MGESVFHFIHHMILAGVSIWLLWEVVVKRRKR